MSLAHAIDRNALYELGVSRALEQLGASQIGLDSLRSITSLEWRVTLRKSLAGGTSVLRYAVTGERAQRLVEKIQHTCPTASVKVSSHNAACLTLAVSLGDAGDLQIEVMFDPNATDDFAL